MSVKFLQGEIMLFLLEWLMVKLGVNGYGVMPEKHSAGRTAVRRTRVKSEFERAHMRFFEKRG